MAWGNGGNGAGSNDKSAGTSITHTWTGDAPAAGEVAIIAVAKNNDSTTDGETNEITSVTDSGSNTYTKLAEYTNGQGAAAGGVTVALFASNITTGLTAGSSTVTANFSSSIAASAIATGIATLTSGNVFQVEDYVVQAADGATDLSLVLSGLTASTEYLFVYATGIEGVAGDTFTNDADYTAWSASATSGGGATTNVGVRTGRRIATITGDTFAPTFINSRDKAGILVALKEVANEVTGDGAATIQLSADGAGDVLVQGEGAGTIQLSAVADGSVLVQGDGAGTIQLSAAGTGTVADASITGDGALTIQLSALADGSVLVQGDGAATIQLSTAADGSVLVQGDGAATIQLSAAGDGAVAIQGDGAATIQLSAAGDGGVLVQGDGAGTIQLSAVADGSVLVQGDGAGTIQLSAAAAGTVADGPTGNGALTIQLSAAGDASVEVQGDGSATIQLSAAGTGELEAVPLGATGALTIALAVAAAAVVANPNVEGYRVGGGLMGMPRTGTNRRRRR